MKQNQLLPLRNPADEFNEGPANITIAFNQRLHPRPVFRKNTHLTGLPVMPFSLYGFSRVHSIDPAMSMWAHRNGASPPSLASIPSTNAFKNSAAVQLPPGLPPVCFMITLVTQSGGKRVPNYSHVAQISVGRIDLRSIFFVQRHAPEPVVFGFARFVQLIPQRVGSLERIRSESIRERSRNAHREDAAVHLSQRNYHRSISP